MKQLTSLLSLVWTSLIRMMLEAKLRLADSMINSKTKIARIDTSRVQRNETNSVRPAQFKSVPSKGIMHSKCSDAQRTVSSYED
jgi:hypothetical protein